MSLTTFREVSEVGATRFADCPLGKLTDGKTLDKVGEYDKPLGVVCENFKNCPIDGNNGHWDGERGNSKWYPDHDYRPLKTNPEQKTWGEILEKHGIDDIEYKDGEPDFSNISEGTVEIKDFSASRTDNFDKADIELAKQRGCTPEEIAKFRKENDYTWHECKDMKTMQLVPSEVHSNMPHSGGVAEVKKGMGE